jgi:hypothetical protein
MLIARGAQPPSEEGGQTEALDCLPLQGSVSRPETVFEEVWADFSTFPSCR